MSSKILFVCLGNICRSPAAEGVARQLMPGIATDSAGTSDWHIGEPPYGPMQAAARPTERPSQTPTPPQPSVNPMT